MDILHYTVYNDLVKRIIENDNWFDDFIKLVKQYYEKNVCGGNLHIVLDEGNISKENLHWCAGLAYGLDDEMGNNLANLMLNMTWHQRKSRI